MDNSLAIIDLDLGAELVGNNKDMAKELLTMLLNALPEHKIEISEAYKENNLEALVKATHKLHGATCYTGTPRLKASAQALEAAAKHQEMDDLPAAYQELVTEIENILNYQEITE